MPKDQTALHLAIIFKRNKAAKLLLEEGANVKLKDGLGNTALHYAADAGNIELMHWLLAMGAPLMKYNNAKWLPFHGALA